MVLVKTIKCELCNSDKSEVIKKDESFNIRGEEIMVRSNVRVCECGNELMDEILDEDNITRAYDLYRKEHNILFPAQIRTIREKYGLTQRALGRVLGCGEITIHRYESGALPSVSHNKLLKLVDNPEVMKQMLIEAQDLIPKTVFKKAINKIDNFLAEKEADSFLNMVQQKSLHTSINIESGFTQFDLEKFINAVLFFAEDVEHLWKTKLNYLLFCADFIFFQKYTISITGSKYVKTEHGLAPEDYEGLLWCLKSCGLIMIRHIGQKYSKTSIIKPLAKPSLEVFTKDEIDVLSKVKDELANCLDEDTIPILFGMGNAYAETPLYEVISYRQALEPV